ncbi:MAG: type II and III secretion system protein family protein [Pseudomonadota bacterium]
MNRTLLKTLARSWPMTLGLGLVCALPISAVQAAGCDDPDFVWPKVLTIKAGLQDTLTLPGAATRLSIGDPATADVTLTDARNLLIQGKKAGETSLLVWTECGKQPARIIVNVPTAMSAAQQVAQTAAPEVLVTLPSQVQADIRFVELSRSRLSEVGARLMARGGKGLVSSPTGSPTSPSASPGVFPTLGFPLDAGAFNILWGGSSSRFLAAINLLEQTGYAYTLSRPSLVAMSGQSANFLAGGEVPIPVPQGANGSVAIEYKEFGVRLSLTPTVLSNQQILLKVAPEVSDLDFNNAVTLQGSVIPALRIRRTDTTISLADGESFIISGLVSRSTNNNASKLPGLGDIPILGAFFRSNRFESEDRELLMIVTPRLVKPLSAKAELPAMPGDGLRNYEPSAGHLFFRGSDSPYRRAPIGFSR